MFIINEDKSIYITRGDAALFAVTAVQDGQPYTFQPNDVVRFKVFEKKGCDTVVLQKDFFVNEACASVDIELLRADTKIGEIIHKPKDFWYEVELNPETYPQTIIGYDEEGAKSFRLLPEGKDLEPDQDEEQQGTAVYDRVLEIVGEMRGHSLQAAEDARNAAESAALADEYARELKADFDAGKYNGLTPYVGDNGNWWIGGKDTGMSAGMQAVGNIVETFRTDLGDDWLLCNGAAIPEGEFPVLRELIPYNTEWVEAVPENEYMHVSPIPNTHKWVRVKRKTGTGTADYAWDKAEVYDAETRTSLTVENPLVVSGKTSLLVGITHDGAKYVLAACCYGEKTAGKYTMHLYASDDLTAWTQIYTYTLTETAYPSDITFDGASYLLADGYVPSDGSTSNNYGRYVWVTPADLSGTKRLYAYGSGYKDPRFRPCPQGYFSWDSSNGDSASIYRAGTTGTEVNAGQVMSGGSSYHPKNIAFFNDRYSITVSHIGNGQIEAFDVFDWATKTKTKMTFTTLFDLATNLGSRVYSAGAEYDPLLNEWSIYFTHSSTYYRARISADADPTVKENYSKTVIKAAPTGLYGQMSLNRARWNENKIRDTSLKCLPEQEGIKYMYVYGGKEHVGKPVELEYIESTGTQYIDTGVIGKTGLEIEIDFEFTEIGTASQIPVGSMKASSNRIYPLSSGNYVGYGEYVKLPMTAAANERYDIYCKLYAGEQTVTVNGTAIYAGLDAATYDSGCSILLFAASNDGIASYHAKTRTRSCKIRENGVLVRDYVPCRQPSGVVCMYDRVSGEYCCNKGAGKFIAGAEIGVLEEV